MKSNTNMVRVLVVTNLLTVFAFFAGCDEPFHLVQKATPPTNCYAGASNETTFPGLNALLVKALVANYRDNQLAAINGRFAAAGAEGDSQAVGSDARAVWFSLEVLKRFIYEIESKTCDACNTPNKTLGVRIYYGAYPELSLWSQPLWSGVMAGVDTAFAGKHTVMMVPTYRNADDKDVDFDPNQVGNGCNFTDIEDLYGKMRTNTPANITLTVLSSINTSIQNHGELVPPPFDEPGILTEGAGIMYAADNY